MSTESTTDAAEDVESFRLRARAWLAENMPRIEGKSNADIAREDENGVYARKLQKILFDGGFAGLCFPVEYGGQGLSLAHQRAFTEESGPYQMPTVLNIPSLSILGATLLDFGTEAQKKRHLPKLISGEEIWVQFLSEPSGGSDLAGLVTKATRDGDIFHLNGSKIWSSGAFRADYALVLARTNPEVPKHSGITVFILKIHQPGVEIQQIKMATGANEFCQEFFDDVPIPIEDVLGKIDDGWTVASRLLFHERDAMGGGSPYLSGQGQRGHGTSNRSDLIELAESNGTLGDPAIRQLIAEAKINETVGEQLTARTATAIKQGLVPGTAGSIPRLYSAMTSERRQEINLEILGTAAPVWEPGAPSRQKSLDYLMRQGGSLGGGSNEMQRNIISERVLLMPREYAADKDKPFNEVLHNQTPTRPR